MTATVHPIRTSRRLAAYEPIPGCLDEAFEAPGRPRPSYSGVLAYIDDGPPQRIAAALTAELDRDGVRFRTEAGDQTFPLDPVPRLISSGEWGQLETGLSQRAAALNEFIADAYGQRRIVAAGVIPERVISGSALYEPAMQGIEVRGGVYAHLIGPDLIRRADGRLEVLEDNLRSPSGLAYALAARRVMALQLPLAQFEPLPLDSALEGLRTALAAATPAGAEDAATVLLCDGPASPAWFEHRALADALGIRLVAPAQLRTVRGRVWATEDGKREPVGVIYRRTEDERLTDASGHPTALGELLLEPIRSGTVGIANAFGAGIADDKLAHAYVDEMIHFYLGQEPLLGSVATHDLAEPRVRADVFEHGDALVVKRRSGAGGDAVHLLSRADRGAREDLAAMVGRQPDQFVAQEEVALSTHPTVRGDAFEPRRIDLRPFVAAAGSSFGLLSAALTRCTPSADSLHVNSSRGGGAKDTWVLA